MRTVAVLSGKGGTGKTSVCASLAALQWRAGKRLVLADADVDASNLPLLLTPVENERHLFTGGETARVEPDLCQGCGICAEQCRFEAIRLEVPEGGREARAAIDPLACEGCGVCSLVCPEDAIRLLARLDGEWTVGETRFGPLVSARLGPAGENSGKLVTRVRRAAAELAAARQAALVLVDGPPGVGCPVIASMSGVDLVVAVTEPAVAAQSDLDRLLRVALRFEVPVAVVINKADLDTDIASALQGRLTASGVEVLGALPYDESVARDQARGLSPAECDGHPCQALAKVAARLDRVLDRLPERTCSLRRQGAADTGDPGNIPDMELGS